MELKGDIILTEAAKEHFQKQAQGYAGVRLSILGGKGCGGSEYDFALVAADQIRTGDDYIDLGNGVRMFVDPTDSIKLFGTNIDLIKDKVGNTRLELTNPNESGQCGCGKSVTF
ncbi:MAG: hypothetical protein AUJ12_03145 [Alphaproteobacteria bacterium CG1_02_46_17]|nr:MAG: hypothetical protein AUJ12_03145 [Alphaproteobacteria bacterium CG1_02_46_17]